MNKSKVANYIFLSIIFSLLFSHIVAIGYSNETGMTDGMYVKHRISKSSMQGDKGTTLTVSKTSDDIFHVTWQIAGSSSTGSWDVNISTNIVSNASNPAPGEGSHNGFWIHIDVSLNDEIMLYNVDKGTDAVFTITGETTYKSMAVWELEDAFGSVVWFEKSKGFYVNGTTRYLTSWEKLEFVETNALPEAGDPGIPGYNYFFLIGLLLVSAIVILKNKSIREKNYNIT